ncbi:MAG: tetratricopeptide repeat protein [Candidatus Binatia bacterium]
MRVSRHWTTGIFAVASLVIVAATFARTDAPAIVSPPMDALAVVLATDAAATAGDPLDARIASLQQRIRTDGPTPATLERLGWTFVEKARATGDHGYYLLAGRCARGIDRSGDDAAQAELLEGHVLQSLHRFDEAGRVAVRLVERRGSALDHGLHGDVLLDQGRLEEAIDAYGRMMRRRPDSRAYARVAEVRLLTGDLEGARTALRTASRAVSPRDREAFAWIWSRLAIVELQSGDEEAARAISEAAVRTAPGSPVAEFARGRVLLASGEYDSAVLALERAVAGSALPDVIRALADAYSAAARPDDAARTLAQLKAGGESGDPRAYSLWLAESGLDPERAFSLAREELTSRRDVYTLGALALAEARTGRIEEARGHMAEALRPGTEDPRLWYHAGVVAAAAGESVEAREWFLKARSQSQLLLPSLQRDLEQRLAAMSSRTSPMRRSSPTKQQSGAAAPTPVGTRPAQEEFS